LLAEERVVPRDGVLVGAFLAVDVYAQDLAKQDAEVLPVVVRVVGRAAVAEHDVQIPVGAEDDGPAVVVPVLVRDAQQLFLGAGVGYVGVVLADAEARNDVLQFGLLVGVENEELAGLLVIGMEGHSEKPLLVLLVVVAHAGLEVEEDLGLDRLLVIGEDVDDAVLGGDEEAVA